MTKKDYDDLAAIIASTKPSHDFPLMLEQWDWTVVVLAAQLKANNPRFDVAKFKAACGYYPLGSTYSNSSVW